MKLVTFVFSFLIGFSAVSFANDTSIISAFESGSLRELKSALDQGVNPNSSWLDETGVNDKPALFYALEAERLDAFKLLIMYGADVNKISSGEGFTNNNLLMVAIRKFARNEGRGRLAKIIKLLLDRRFEVAGKVYEFKFNPYARGGAKGNEDAISVALNNDLEVDSLGLLYSHKNINPNLFIHKDEYLINGINKQQNEVLNLYLNFNSTRVGVAIASNSLVLMEKNAVTDKGAPALELFIRLQYLASGNA